MIVSRRHRFIFIKTHKTAGTSIEISLSRYCGASDIVSKDRHRVRSLVDKREGWLSLAGRDRYGRVHRRRKESSSDT